MITEQRDATALIFKLAGVLAGDWAIEFERCWRSASAIEAASEATCIIVDLSDVTFVDDFGRETLCLMVSEGAELIARDVLMKSIVDEIVQKASVRVR